MIPLVLALVLASQELETPDVAVAPVEGTPPVRSIPAEAYTGLHAALRNLDFGFVERHGVEGPPAELARALEALLTGDAAAGRARIAELARGEGEVAQAALSIHLHLLFGEERYAELDRAGGGAIATMLAALPEPRVRFVEEPVSEHLELSSVGCPVVEVVLNGKRRLLWLDTGAALTTLRKSVAAELGIEPASERATDIGTGTSKQVSSRVASIARLEIGRAVLEDHAAFLLDDADLTFDLPGGERIVIDGAVGWNAVRLGRVVLDYGAGRYVFERSAPAAGTRDLAWLGYPLVRLRSGDGYPLLFGLDTGARVTTITEQILAKASFASVREATVTVGGAGGFEDLDTRVAGPLELLVGRHRFTFAEARCEPDDNAHFVALDGVLGSDAARGCRMTVDFLAGAFELVPSRAD